MLCLGLIKSFVIAQAQTHLQHTDVQKLSATTTLP